jgi:hypothetical protein
VGALIGGVGVTVWWLRLGQLRWWDRALVVVSFVACGAGIVPLCHPTFVDQFRGPILDGTPLVTTAWVLWLLVSGRFPWTIRRLGILAAIGLAWGYCTLLRIDGVNARYEEDVHWRWDPTAEERFLAELAGRKVSEPRPQPLQLKPGDWPGFLGPKRDGCLTGVRIESDWKQNPPRAVWRHRIGPGWSSFAVVGDRLFTQEQRGANESVICYDALTGEEVWAHNDTARFAESVGGAGPRATPTFYEGSLYTLGASGRLNCLDAAMGRVIWSRDLLADSGRNQPPQYGFSSSPLVVAGVVTVFAGGPGGKSVLGYRPHSGELAWAAGEGRESYSSPHLLRLCGIEQILMVCGDRLTTFAPEDGKVHWQRHWPQAGVDSILQPMPDGDSDLLVGIEKQGIQRLHLTHDGDGWHDQQVWETRAIKPYFNNLVVYKDHLYGSEGQFFTCVSLGDGKATWRTRGYANSQILLLSDVGLLLVLSENGEVALVPATPERPAELGRFQAIEGKTWNHPVLAHGMLFLRNADEAACYELMRRTR